MVNPKRENDARDKSRLKEVVQKHVHNSQTEEDILHSLKNVVRLEYILKETRVGKKDEESGYSNKQDSIFQKFASRMQGEWESYGTYHIQRNAYIHHSIHSEYGDIQVIVNLPYKKVHADKKRVLYKIGEGDIFSKQHEAKQGKGETYGHHEKPQKIKTFLLVEYDYT